MARTVIHPGEHLAEQIQELGMSAAELGRQIKVATNRITGILSGQREVTGGSVLTLKGMFQFHRRCSGKCQTIAVTSAEPGGFRCQANHVQPLL